MNAVGKRDPKLEAALVERFQDGDESAFNEIVGLYADKVLSLCTYYLKNGEEAWDVSQEVFMKIHRGLARFRGEAKLSTWVHTITLNACRNRISSWRRLFVRKKKWDADPNARRRVETPEETFLRDERSEVVRHEIQQLRPKYRDIILLKDMQECSYEEIGEILGLAPGTVKSRLHRARDALAERLERVWPDLASKENAS